VTSKQKETGQRMLTTHIAHLDLLLIHAHTLKRYMPPRQFRKDNSNECIPMRAGKPSYSLSDCRESEKPSYSLSDCWESEKPNYSLSDCWESEKRSYSLSDCWESVGPLDSGELFRGLCEYLSIIDRRSRSSSNSCRNFLAW